MFVAVAICPSYPCQHVVISDNEGDKGGGGVSWVERGRLKEEEIHTHLESFLNMNENATTTRKERKKQNKS